MSATADHVASTITARPTAYDAEGSAEANLPDADSAVRSRTRRRPARSAPTAAASADYHPSRAGQRAHRAARGLGWFSIALGLAELLAPHAVARAVGLQGREGLVRLYGLREIATGIGLLTARDPSPWVWGRVAGDAIDLATLGASTHSGSVARPLLGIAAVAGVTAADLATAKGLHTEAERQRRPVFDYSDRSGFPQGMATARGAALQSFETPRDLRGPESMRPHSGGADEFEAQKRSRDA
jgi:hypothetical protein